MKKFNLPHLLLLPTAPQANVKVEGIEAIDAENGIRADGAKSPEDKKISRCEGLRSPA